MQTNREASHYLFQKGNFLQRRTWRQLSTELCSWSLQTGAVVLLFSAESMDWQQCWVLVGGREHRRVSGAQAVQSMRSHLAGEVQEAAELSWGRARETLMWERQMLGSNISDCQTLRITLGKLFKRQIQGPHSGRFYF